MIFIKISKQISLLNNMIRENAVYYYSLQQIIANKEFTKYKKRSQSFLDYG